MKNIFITGATGNIGQELIKQLYRKKKVNIIAGFRNKKKAISLLNKYSSLDFRYFDFEDQNSFNDALENMDMVFLLRPPHISDIDKYFYPLLKKMKDKGISKIVFLSVQGAEKSKIIPHNKIESLIKFFNFKSIILRPSYFMQNLTTTLGNEIIDRQITLPSGKAKFNWIDILDIAEVAAEVIIEFEKYEGNIYELTGTENMSFKEVTEKINSLLNLNIKYKSVAPIKYFGIKKQEGIEKDKILVMLLLHFLPRFQKAPQISKNIELLLGRPPTALNDFILRNKDSMTGSK